MKSYGPPLNARVERSFRVDPAAPHRLYNEAQHHLLIDHEVRELLDLVHPGATVGDLVEASGRAEEAYAAISVLGLAEMVRFSPEWSPRTLAGRRIIDPPSECPTVTLIVVNFNGSEDLPTLLESIRRQNYPAIQAIVVDNASSDESLAALSAEGGEIEVIALPENVGFAGAFNAGMRHARGEYVAILNSDVELYPDTVSAWVQKAYDRPDAAAIAPKLLLAAHPMFINAIGTSIPCDGWGSDNFNGLLDLGQFDDVEEVFAACFGATLFTPAALEAVGPLDEKYFLYYEDSDWSYRARLAGFAIVAARDCRILHQVSRSVGKEVNTFKLRFVVRNRIRFALLNVGEKMLWRCLSNYLLSDLRWMLGSAAGRRFAETRAFIRAYSDLLLEAPQLVAGRRSRRRSRAVVEPDWSIGIAPHAAATPSGEPIVSMEVVRRCYVPLLRLP